MEFDLNCKTCIHFKKKPLQGSNQHKKNICSKKNRLEFDCACLRWEPDLELISENLIELEELLNKLSYAELQAVPHMVEHRVQTLKSNSQPHHKIGRCGVYRYKDRKLRLKIQNFSEEMIFGVKKTGNGFRRFRVPPDTIKKS